MTKNANCLLCKRNTKDGCDKKVHQTNDKPSFGNCDFFIRDKNKWT